MRRHRAHVGPVAELELGAGRRLESLVLHGDGGGARHVHDPRRAADEVASGGGPAAMRELLQASGLWMRFRARPFGRVPAGDTSPATIFVMTVDTRPLAPDPRLAVQDTEALDLGMRALGRLCDGPVHVCQDRGPPSVPASGRLRIVHVGPLHPAGLAGTQIHRLFPAQPDRPVWGIAAEDVAAIGQLLSEGRLPGTRLVPVAGPGLRQTRLVRCQPGADLRELCHAHMIPGPRTILSGQVPDGREARWLGWFDRQTTVIRRPEAKPPRHWLGPSCAVQLVEMVLDRFFPVLFATFSVFLSLLAVHCAILGGSLFMSERRYDLAESTVFGLGAGRGFAIAVIMLSAIRRRLAHADLPAGLQRLGIAFILTGMLSLGFATFVQVAQP